MSFRPTYAYSFVRLSEETDVVGYPVLPLIRQLAETTPPDIAKYIHWGATTQDIMDNAMMLQIRSGIQLVRQELLDLITCLVSLAKRHRDTSVKLAGTGMKLTSTVPWLDVLICSMHCL